MQPSGELSRPEESGDLGRWLEWASVYLPCAAAEIRAGRHTLQALRGMIHSRSLDPLSDDLLIEFLWWQRGSRSVAELAEHSAVPVRSLYRYFAGDWIRIGPQNRQRILSYLEQPEVRARMLNLLRRPEG